MSRPTDFRFDPEAHEYWLNGRRLPSVTEVLNDLVDYSRVAPEVLEHKRQVGEALHEAIALGDDLDMGSLDPAVEPYYAAWQRFVSETGYEPLEFEQQGYHETYYFAGTWDQIGTFNGKLALPDIKTLAVDTPVTSLQTAAYAAIRDQHQRKKVRQRFALQLTPDRNPPYRLHEHKDPADFKTFLACLSRHQWALKNGVRNER